MTIGNISKIQTRRTILNFDDREKELNGVFNEIINTVKELKWAKAEQKLHLDRANKIEQKLFFLYIDVYIQYLYYDITNAELEAEYKVLNQ